MGACRSAGAAGALPAPPSAPSFLVSDEALEVLTLWQRLTAHQRQQLLNIIRVTASLNEAVADRGAEADPC